VGIPESDVAAVRSIEKFRVKVDALGNKTFEGRFHFLSKSTDSRAMLYRLEIALENPDGSLLPDMFARVEIVKKEVSDGLAIPLFALMENSDEQTVFVVNDEHAHRRPVAIGIQDGWQIQVIEGLRAADKVIVVGQRSLNDGDPVKVVKTVTRIEELDQ
jgi:membrane fusion protein (multidrug efflux system)